MPTYQIASRPAQGKDISRKTGLDPAFRATQVVYGRGYRPVDRVPIVATMSKPGKYLPHIGAKESAKFVARQQAKHVECLVCGEFGEPGKLDRQGCQQYTGCPF